MKRAFVAAYVCVAMLMGSTVHGAEIQVRSLEPTIAPGEGTWGTFIQGAGTAEIVRLDGLGGNLELNQPSPPAAVRLTTGADNADRGEIGISRSFGDAATTLTDLSVGYSYYKVDNGPSEFAAPALKLAIFAPGGTGDNFGQLVYEPSWNQGAGSQQPPTDAWQQVLIDEATGGGGNDTTGGWWWTGGFEQPSGAGGPPIRSAAEWAALFALDPDFSNAEIVGINVGVGTFNQNQIGYVDQVTFGDDVFNFTIPEPASIAIWSMLGLALAGTCYGMRRRQVRPRHT